MEKGSELSVWPRKIPGEARQAEASTETTLLANYFMQDDAF